MDTIILFVVVVAALVGMSTYIQRAFLGNLKSGAAAIGAQFDPRDTYSETQGITSTDMIEHHVLGGTVGAYLMDGRIASKPRPGVSLPDIPTGPVHREPAAQDAVVTANWSTTHSASYRDDR